MQSKPPSWLKSQREIKRYTEIPKPGSTPENVVQPNLEMDSLNELIEEIIKEKKLSLTSEQKNDAINSLKNLMPKDLNLKNLKEHQKDLIGLAFLSILAKKENLAKDLIFLLPLPEKRFDISKDKLNKLEESLIAILPKNLKKTPTPTPDKSKETSENQLDNAEITRALLMGDSSKADLSEAAGKSDPEAFVSAVATAVHSIVGFIMTHPEGEETLTEISERLGINWDPNEDMQEVKDLAEKQQNEANQQSSISPYQNPFDISRGPTGPIKGG